MRSRWKLSIHSLQRERAEPVAISHVFQTPQEEVGKLKYFMLSSPTKIEPFQVKVLARLNVIFFRSPSFRIFLKILKMTQVVKWKGKLIWTANLRLLGSAAVASKQKPPANNKRFHTFPPPTNCGCGWSFPNVSCDYLWFKQWKLDSVECFRGHNRIWSTPDKNRWWTVDVPAR